MKFYICSFIYALPISYGFSQIQYHGCKTEIYHQRQSIDYGRYERTCHNGRVKSDFLRQHGKRTAYEFCYKYGSYKCKAYNTCDRYADLVDNYKLHEIGRCKRNTDQHGYPYFFPYCSSIFVWKISK